MNNRYYKIIKIVNANSIQGAIKAEKKAEIIEVFCPDSIPAFLQEHIEKNKK